MEYKITALELQVAEERQKTARKLYTAGAGVKVWKHKGEDIARLKGETRAIMQVIEQKCLIEEDDEVSGEGNVKRYSLL
ncbi:MAG: hypothetical protein OXD43_13960 [Bacteroidetes bacterium]|nr:hypothetical protein [Bacteroidota bacterium]